MTIGLKLRRLFVALLPKHIDQLLYQYEPRSDGPAPSVTHAPASLTSANTGPDELTIHRFDVDHPSGLREIDANLSAAVSCYAVLDGGRVAHVSYLFTNTRLPGQSGFDPSIPVIGACFTDPNQRGRHLYPRVLSHILYEQVLSGKLPTIYILVAPDNEPSIRGIERAGFTRKARIRGTRIGGILFDKSVTLPTPDRVGDSTEPI
jgi:RimJ/RimL family protein N-acetyltransferase